MGQYHDLYLKSDVLLLADIFENFREQYLDTYGLDPAHYVSLPSSSWDAMLKMTGVRLDLISDVDMFNFIEKGMRVGISTITLREKPNIRARIRSNTDRPTSRIQQCSDVFDSG